MTSRVSALYFYSLLIILCTLGCFDFLFWCLFGFLFWFVWLVVVFVLVFCYCFIWEVFCMFCYVLVWFFCKNSTGFYVNLVIWIRCDNLGGQ